MSRQKLIAGFASLLVLVGVFGISNPAYANVFIDTAEIQADGRLYLRFDDSSGNNVSLEGRTPVQNFMVIVNNQSVSYTGNLNNNVTALYLTLGTTVKPDDDVTLNYNGHGKNTAIRESETSQLPNFTGMSVVNKAEDNTAPNVSSANVATDGTTLTINFDEPMKAATAPAGFSVSELAAGASSASSVSISSVGDITQDGTSIQLTLANAIQPGSDVFLSYSGTSVEDKYNNDLGVITNLSVTNNAVDNTPPTVLQASLAVDGETLTLTFDEAMAAVSSPNGFSAEIEGSTVGVSAGSISSGGTSLELTLAQQAASGETVTLSYDGSASVTDNSTNTNSLAPFGAVSVTNNVPELIPPEVSSASLAANGVTLTVTFNEGMSAISSPTGFEVKVDGVALSGETIGNIAAGGTQLIITLSGAVQNGESVTLSYAPGTVTDDSSSPNALAGFTDLSVTNNVPDTTPPTFSAASVSSNGLDLTISFSESMSAATAPQGLTVNIDSVPVTLATVSDLVASATVLDLVLSDPVLPGETVTIDYDVAAGSLEDEAGNALASFTGEAVTNNSTFSPAGTTPPPYTGPIIGAVEEPVDSDFAAAGQETVVLKGERLGGVTRAIIDGKEAEILSVSSDSVEIVIPEDLAPGTYDVQIESSLGNLTYLDAITIQGSVEASSFGEVSAWTSRISDTQVKVYVKFPTVGEKVRIGHQTGGSGSYESVYVKTTSSETMEGLRIVEGVGTYVVRTIDLAEINRIRVTVGDEELVQVRYNN